MLADVGAEALEAQQARLAAAGHEAYDVPTDVSDPDAVEALAQTRRDEVEERLSPIMAARGDVIDLGGTT